MDGGEGTRARTLLGLSCAATVRALRAGENAARGDDQDVTVRELLLKLASEAVTWFVSEIVLIVGGGGTIFGLEVGVFRDE